jgi:hypothetical protein
MDAAQDVMNRYVAVWHETDPERRRAAIAALWVPDGEHYVGTREVRGYADLQARVTGSYEKNVRDAGNHFRATTNARVLRDVVTFDWAMLSAGDDVLATGLEVLIVDEQCRIRVDYQFVLS